MVPRQISPPPRVGAVDGYVHPAFAPVAAYFARLFGPRSQGGGALSVRFHGEPVIDLWAGFADRRSSRLWEKETVTICFSTTKGITAAVIHRLADRGLLDYDAPVADHWPEFAAAGKQAITVRQLLSHQAGLHSMVGLVNGPSDLLDHIQLEKRLAERTPDAWPGHSGYHALTFGWLMAGLARHVTGLGMAELVRRELAEPLSSSGLGIGMPTDGLARFAPLLGRTPPIRPTPPALERFYRRSVMPALRRHPSTRRFADAMEAPGLEQLLRGSSPAVLGTEMPAVNGLFSADGLAKLYATMAGDGTVDGVRMFSAETIHKLSQVQVTTRDAVLGLRMLWRLGYHRAGAPGFSQADAFGHYGFGGSGGWADRTSGVSFGFVTNELRLLQAPVGGDSRIFRLSGLVLRSAYRLG
jgi:CubicO group peptidase (beta-lactamase class C family)